MSHYESLIRNAAQKSIPIDVSLELTHHCNYRCQHCYIPDFSVPNALTIQRIMRLLEELAEMGTLHLTLTGGEMFLRKEWYQIAKRSRELGFALRLFSNGSLIDERIADQVASLGVAIEITVFSMNAQVSDEITQKPGSFDLTIRGIESLSRHSVDLMIKVPIMTLNAGSWQSVETYAKNLGVSFMSFASIYAKKNGDPSTIALRVPSEDLVDYYQGSASAGQVEREIREDEPLCAAASRYCNITSGGDVMACNLLPGSGGNLQDRSFRDIWEQSPWLNQVRSIRKRDLHTCDSCQRLSYCGRCHAQALIEDGDLYGPSSAAKERADVLDQIEGEAFAV